MNEEQAPMDFYDGTGKRLLRVDGNTLKGAEMTTGTIHFHTNLNATEVMRLSKDGVWVNPDIKPDEAAQAVLNALGEKIRVIVQRAVAEEREACAKVCLDGVANAADWDSSYWDQACENRAAAIRSRT